MIYRSLFFFDLACTQFNPALYKSIEIRGVKPELCVDDKRVVCNVMTDEANPQFFSAYLIDLEGHAICVADSHLDWLDGLRDVSKSFQASTIGPIGTLPQKNMMCIFTPLCALKCRVSKPQPIK